MINDWDTLFMNMVYLIAMKSKDPRTHLGAVIVGSNNEVVSLGYNGLPRGLSYSKEKRLEPPEKYYYFEHAERNAIYNAILIGVSLKGCRMYTNGTPCTDCARAIIQSGIKEVIVDEVWDKNNKDKWLEHSIKSKEMFKEVGIKLRTINTELVDINKYRRGKLINIH